MKIAVCESCFGMFTWGLYRAFEAQAFELIQSQCDNKIKQLQLYSSFKWPGKDYPFMQDSIAYYPITVVFFNGNHIVRWVKWDTAEILEKYKGAYDAIVWLYKRDY